MAIKTSNLSKLPSRQRKIINLKSKLRKLIEEHPYISYCIDDKAVSEELAGSLEKLGFISQILPSKTKTKLLWHLQFSLKKEHLILIHYLKKLDGSNILTVLSELRKMVPYQQFKNIIPIFVASPANGKERELFRLLSQYDIRYVIFLPPNVTADAKLERVLDELCNYQDMMFMGASFMAEHEPQLSRAEENDAKVVARYNELVEQADEKMTSDPEGAIELFTKAIELSPDFNVLMKRGDAHYRIRNFIPALNDFKQAHKLERVKADPYAKISACCFVLVKQTANANKDVAKKWLKTGLASLTKAEKIIDEGMGKAVLNSNNEGILQDSFKNVISALAEADFRGMGLDEVNDDVADLVGRVFEKTSDVDFLNSEMDVDARIDFAKLKARNKNYAEAENIFRSVISDDPSNVGPAFNNFAVELRKNGENGKAFEVYLECLKFKIPDREIVIRNLMMAGRRYAKGLRVIFKLEEATAVYKNILHYAPKSSGREWVLLDLAMTYLEQQDQAQAAFRLMEAIYIFPGLMDTELFNEEYRDLESLKQEMIKKLTKGAL